MRIVKPRIMTIIDILVFIFLSTFVLLLANAMHACARVDGVIYCPIMTFPSICERSGNFFEARIQREVMADRVLEE
jgi:hypothetical protein